MSSPYQPESSGRLTAIDTWARYGLKPLNRTFRQFLAHCKAFWHYQQSSSPPFWTFSESNDDEWDIRLIANKQYHSSIGHYGCAMNFATYSAVASKLLTFWNGCRSSLPRRTWNEAFDLKIQIAVIIHLSGLGIFTLCQKGIIDFPGCCVTQLEGNDFDEDSSIARRRVHLRSFCDLGCNWIFLNLYLISLSCVLQNRQFSHAIRANPASDHVMSEEIFS
jgi:hypothetical protein